MNGQVRATMRFPLFAFAVALATAGTFGLGCDATRRDWGTCYQNRCGSGHGCTPDHRCIPFLDGGAWETSQVDVPKGMDGAVASPPIDGSPMEVSSSVDASEDVPVSAGSVDVVVGATLDSATEAGQAGSVDSGAVDVGTVDANNPDAAGTCASDNDCTGKDAPYCVQGRCVSCATGDQCSGGAPICSASHACVSCAAVDAGCRAATPACEADSGRCLECLGDGDCVRDASKSFCQAGTCVGCAGAGILACAGRNPANPVCMPSGLCAECATSVDCKFAAKPICDNTANACVACKSDDECQAKVGGPGVCMFQQDGHCANDAETVYVGKNGAGTCSDSGLGAVQMPYCTAQTAIGVAKSALKQVVVVMGQVGGFSIGALSAPLTIVGKSAVISPADYADGISLTRGEIYLRGLNVAGNPSGVTGIGVNAQAATGSTVLLHMDGCTVKDNPGGGILLAGASFDIRNSKVSGNGPAQTAGGTSWGGIRIESLPAGGQASLNLVTIQKNLAPGLSCAGAIQGQGVLATDNAQPDIATSCGNVVSCGSPSPTCGAQP
jgi:hypothetical protein